MMKQYFVISVVISSIIGECSLYIVYCSSFDSVSRSHKIKKKLQNLPLTLPLSLFLTVFFSDCVQVYPSQNSNRLSKKRLLNGVATNATRRKSRQRRK